MVGVVSGLQSLTSVWEINADGEEGRLVGGLSTNVRMTGKESGLKHFHSVFFFLFFSFKILFIYWSEMGWGSAEKAPAGKAAGRRRSGLLAARSPM